MKHEAMYGGFEVPKSATFITGLPFGNGKIGAQGLLDPIQYENFGQALGNCTVPLSQTNTADCVDGRETVALGNGVNDPSMLEARVVPQVAGGLVLTATKAAIGADLVILRDAKNFTDAYLKMNALLTALGYEDGGHDDCGASKQVEGSVAHEVADEPLLLALPLLAPVDDSTSYLLGLNKAQKHRKLESGFYGTWSNTWHEGFLMDTVPQNFSILHGDPADHETHGHAEGGIYAVKSAGYGFAKNRFIRETGSQAFATTTTSFDTLTSEIIAKIGGSNEERARLRLEFGVDAPQVLDRLVVKGMPVFAEAA